MFRWMSLIVLLLVFAACSAPLDTSPPAAPSDPLAGDRDDSGLADADDNLQQGTARDDPAPPPVVEDAATEVPAPRPQPSPGADATPSESSGASPDALRCASADEDTWAAARSSGTYDSYRRYLIFAEACMAHGYRARYWGDARDALVSNTQSSGTRPPRPDPIDETADPVAGRVAHHAPETMVAGHPYILEVLIRPVAGTDDIAEIDTGLREEIGEAPSPGGRQTAVAITDTAVGKVMLARLSATAGVDVLPVTPERQPIFAGQTAKWAWSVTATETVSAASLVFSVLREVEANGETFEQSVKTLPVTVKIRSVDDLLTVASVDRGVASSNAPEAVTSTLAPRNAEAAIDQSPGTCTTISGANPDRRALILSNKDYVESVGPLALTHKDGERVTDALVELGYTVTHCRDLDDIATHAALKDHGRDIKDRRDAGGSPSAFFYYSGHGVTNEGRSFLIPTNLTDLSDEAISSRGIDSEDVINLVSATGAATAFVVFDACRNTVGKGASKGIAPVGWGSASGGLLQAYATAPGDVAADNGYYSEALASALRNSSKKADLVFDDVQTLVANRTNNRQIPFTSDGFTRDFYFSRP